MGGVRLSLGCDIMFHSRCAEIYTLTISDNGINFSMFVFDSTLNSDFTLHPWALSQQPLKIPQNIAGWKQDEK